MRIAVAGGTGLVGSLVVTAARAHDHEVTIISRSRGTDLVTGAGLGAALAGCEVVIDVTEAPRASSRASTAFFAAATGHLLAAGTTAGVRHHVALSIVGIDRVPLGYYAGKRRQEQLVADASVPWTVLRATQFHEFPGQVLAKVPGPIAPVPRMTSATVAAREVAEHLVELAEGEPLGRAPELAGPAVEHMPDLARRVLRARRSRRLVMPVRLPGRTGREQAGGGLLPAADGPRGRQTFQEWLVEHEGA